jgi:hypothetical protein
VSGMDDWRLARRTGRFPQLVDPRSSVNRLFLSRFARVSRTEFGATRKRSRLPHLMEPMAATLRCCPPAQLIKGHDVRALFARLERRIVVITDDAAFIGLPFSAQAQKRCGPR